MKEANWYTKQQVAELFGCSKKSVERWVKKGKLTPTFVTGRHGKQAVFDPEEVESLKELEDSMAIDRSVVPGESVTVPTQTPTLTPALVNQAVESVSMPLNSLVTVTRENRSVPIHCKLFLSLNEAKEFSGLPRAFIKEAINSGELEASIIGRGWRIKRAELERWASKI